MFGYVIAAGAALIFGGFAVAGALKPTGEKVKNGDSVFVNTNALRLNGTPNNIDDAGLKAFLSGVLNSNIKVSDIHLTSTSELTGTILGFPRLLSFDKSAVVSIERNGTKIT